MSHKHFLNLLINNYCWASTLHSTRFHVAPNLPFLRQFLLHNIPTHHSNTYSSKHSEFLFMFLKPRLEMQKQYGPSPHGSGRSAWGQAQLCKCISYFCLGDSVTICWLKKVIWPSEPKVKGWRYTLRTMKSWHPYACTMWLWGSEKLGPIIQFTTIRDKCYVLTIVYHPVIWIYYNFLKFSLIFGYLAYS